MHHLFSKRLSPSRINVPCDIQWRQSHIVYGNLIYRAIYSPIRAAFAGRTNLYRTSLRPPAKCQRTHIQKAFDAIDISAKFLPRLTRSQKMIPLPHFYRSIRRKNQRICCAIEKTKRRQIPRHMKRESRLLAVGYLMRNKTGFVVQLLIGDNLKKKFHRCIAQWVFIQMWHNPQSHIRTLPTGIRILSLPHSPISQKPRLVANSLRISQRSSF